MDNVAPLAVFVPLVGAAVLAGLTGLVKRIVADIYVLVVTLLTVALTAVLFDRTGSHRVVHWFGGWTPKRGQIVGVNFAVDRFGAGTALLVAVLALAALVFSWHSLESGSRHFHVLMLLFEGGMIGFALTGDLFLLFVFFELMSVAAYALTGLQNDEPGALQGAINFAVVNSIGSFALLFGIGLVYARTGSLNFALIGSTLAAKPVDGLVVVALTLLLTGMFTKAAIVPFHFWLADAHAVAPTPVCVLFSGIMVEIALYGAARIYWTMFAGALTTHTHDYGAVLLGLGVVSVIFGAILCFAQHDIKRLLAFSTISHVGVVLIGIGLMSRDGLAGAAMYVAGHGAVKGSLFIVAGIILHRTRALDEITLHERGRQLRMWPSAILFTIGGLALAGLPPFALALGKTMIEEAGSQYRWLPYVIAFGGVCTGGAVLRVTGRVFCGWGPREGSRYPADEFAAWEEDQETEDSHDRTPLTLIAPAAALLCGALALGLWPHIAGHTEHAAARFADRPAYASAVLTGRDHLVTSPTKEPAITGAYIGLAEAAGAVALAAIALLRERAPAVFRRVLQPARSALHALRVLHSGQVGDYVAWFTLGLAAFGGLAYLALH